MKGNIKHFFPGGNTSKGFYSFYRYILNQDDARRIICIKGGPGTGKSSLMKRIGNFFCEKGYDIEFHHCSSDNNSLDGVVVKNLNVALLDGTAPHVVDPINPGAVDEILNMGNCWKEEGFKQYRKSIINLNKKVGKTFKHAYRYIGAAKLIHDDWNCYNTEALNLTKLNVFKEDLMNNIFKSSLPISYGKERHLFATAFTPNGIITYINYLCKDCENTYVLNGGPGTGKTIVLTSILNESIKHGLFVEVYHDPLIPERIEHIIIPELKTAILTSNEINRKGLEGKQIYMDDFLNNSLLTSNRANIEISKTTFYSLLNKGLDIIHDAKSLHDKLEKYYIPNMDFEKVEKVSQTVINKLLEYEKEYLNN